jgi:flagellar motor protein MotB
MSQFLGRVALEANMRFPKTHTLSAAAAALTLIAAIGCTSLPVYKKQYHTEVAKNKDLHELNRAQAGTIIELNELIEHLKGKTERADDALTSQGQRQRAEEERKRVLLALIQGALEGSPAVAEQRGDTYVVVTRFSFESGRADLDAKAKRDLRRIAATLKEGFPKATLLVAGHADNTRILKSRYASNWHLSGERARSVMEFLVADCKIPPENIAYAGYGEFRPVADNNTPASREKNRRVEIIVTP